MTTPTLTFPKASKLPNKAFLCRHKKNFCDRGDINFTVS